MAVPCSHGFVRPWEQSETSAPPKVVCFPILALVLHRVAWTLFLSGLMRSPREHCSPHSLRGRTGSLESGSYSVCAEGCMSVAKAGCHHVRDVCRLGEGQCRCAVTGWGLPLNTGEHSRVSSALWTPTESLCRSTRVTSAVDEPGALGGGSRVGKQTSQARPHPL